jgi:ABC-type microcin C transport system permease subunit YejB
MSRWLYGIRGALVVATIAGLLGIGFVYVWGDMSAPGGPVDVFVGAAFLPTLVYLVVSRARGELPTFPRSRRQ